MPLETTSTINANIIGKLGQANANVSATVQSAKADVDGIVNAVVARVSSRLAPNISSTVDALVPRRLGSFNETSGFRKEAYVYVDGGNEDLKMSLRGVKDMNTKIVDAKDTTSVDYSKVVEGDYIYTEN